MSATVLTGSAEPCRDRRRAPGEFGRALTFAAENVDLYERDSMLAMRKGYLGIHSGQWEFRVDGVRIDSHVVALHGKLF